MSDKRTDSDFIAQRTAYYCNTLFNLQQLIKDIDDKRACKWYDKDKDDNPINAALSYLYHAEHVITRRYRDVLSERADDLMNRLEESNE